MKFGKVITAAAASGVLLSGAFMIAEEYTGHSAFAVTLSDNTKVDVKAKKGTVREILAANNISYNADDRVEPGLDTKVNGGEITFDSASTEVPEQVKKAAFALDVNGVSDVITAAGTQAYSSQYYIVKLIKKTEKSSNIDDYKEKLKTVILTQKQNDATFVQGVISKELQAANIKVKDQAFQNIFTQYIGGGDSSSSSSSKE